MQVRDFNPRFYLDKCLFLSDNLPGTLHQNEDSNLFNCRVNAQCTCKICMCIVRCMRFRDKITHQPIAMVSNGVIQCRPQWGVRFCHNWLTLISELCRRQLMISPRRNLLCGPSMDPKPSDSHHFPVSKTTHLAAHSDVRVSQKFECQ